MSNTITIPTDKAGLVALFNSIKGDYLNRAAKEKEIKQEILLQTVTKVADALGFHVVRGQEINDWSYRIADHNNRTLSLSINWHEYRLTVVAFGLRDGSNHPITAYKDGKRLETPTITLALGKPAEQIAKDITRRVFPALGEYLVEAEKALQDITRRGQLVEANKKAVQDLFGALVSPSATGGDTLHLYLSTGEINRGYGDIQVGSDYINLKLSNLRPELALEVLKLIAKEGK